MNEIRINPDAFNSKLDSIGRGFNAGSTLRLVKNGETASNSPFLTRASGLLVKMDAVQAKYHEFLGADTADCKRLGALLVQADQYISRGLANSLTQEERT